MTATHTAGLITTKQLVNGALWQADRKPNYYRIFYKYAIQGYRELRLHHVREGVKFAKCTPTSINTVPFPEDMVDFVAIGIPISGRFVQFTRDDDIVRTTSLTNLIETLDSEDGEGVAVYDSNTSGYFAKGGVNLDGYYTIDYDNRRIILNSVTRTEVVLAYLSSGVNATGETYVPVKYVPALTAFIVWQDARFNITKLSNAQYYHDQYRYELGMLDENYTIDELVNAWISTYTMLPTR